MLSAQILVWQSRHCPAVGSVVVPHSRILRAFRVSYWKTQQIHLIYYICCSSAKQIKKRNLITCIPPACLAVCRQVSMITAFQQCAHLRLFLSRSQCQQYMKGYIPATINLHSSTNSHVAISVCIALKIQSLIGLFKRAFLVFVVKFCCMQHFGTSPWKICYTFLRPKAPHSQLHTYSGTRNY